MSASLQGANLNGAQLQSADLSGTNMQGADLSSASLQGVSLSEAHLQGANLAAASLQGANLSAAHLQGANLSAASLQGADLRAAHLQGANLSGASLQAADLSAAHLEGSELNEARLWRTNLDGADLGLSNLRQADFWTPIPDEDKKSLHAAIEAKTHNQETSKQLEQLFGADPSAATFKASPKFPVLVDNIKDPIFNKIPVGWLISSPTPSYVNARTFFIVDELSSTDPDVAEGIALRAVYRSDVVVGCRLMANVELNKVKLRQEMVDKLSNWLRQRREDCKLAIARAIGNSNLRSSFHTR